MSTFNDNSSDIYEQGGSGGGGITGGLNLDIGANIFEGVAGSDLTFRTITPGPGITLVDNGTNWEIQSQVIPSRVNYSLSNFSANTFNSEFNIDGARGSSILSPFTATLNELYIFNRNSVGTNFPVQLGIYETSNSFANSQIFNRVYQSAFQPCINRGYVLFPSIALNIIQGRTYYFVFQRNNAGGSTAPLFLSQNGSHNNAGFNFSANDTGPTMVTDFTCVIDANSVTGLTGSSPSSNSIWFLGLCS